MPQALRLNPASRLVLFLAVAAAGLAYVKWLPYWDRAFVAASSHSIGGSILMGKAAHAPAPSWGAALGYALAYGKSIWQALILGLVIGSGVQALLPADWVMRLFGKRPFGSAVAGGLLALPGMMCTCCAAPVVAGLRRQQASAGGAIAFWLGNSVLNPATLVFIGFVLGWRWTALRLVLGLPMVLGLGYLANRMTTPGEAAGAQKAAARLGAAPQEGLLRRWLAILARMTLQLVPEYILLVLLLGAGRAWLFPAMGPQIGDHALWIAAFALAGALFVIPTAGEV
ncbi:MAG: permease, partial [Caulobacteraceae bacterium]